MKRLGIIISLSILAFLIKVYFTKPKLTIKLEEEMAKTFNGLPMIQDILKEKYKIKIDNIKGYDLIFDGVRYTPIDDQLTQDKALKISYVWEAVKPNLDVYDLSIGFDFIEHPKYIRVPLYYVWYRNKISTEYDRGKCNPHKKYFACFLFGNGGGINPLNHKPYDGCTARNSLFHKLSMYKRVESGGGYLNNIGRVIPRSEKDSIEWLSQCKFVIAYENQSYKGYITEKPFQAYFAGAIPLYYADPSVFQDINKKAVIYAGDFETEEQMIEYIKKIDSDDELYCQIWNQKIITDHNKHYEVVKRKLSTKIYELIDPILKTKSTKLFKFE